MVRTFSDLILFCTRVRHTFCNPALFKQIHRRDGFNPAAPQDIISTALLIPAKSREIRVQYSNWSVAEMSIQYITRPLQRRR